MMYGVWPQPRLSPAPQSRNKVDSGLLRLMFEGGGGMFWNNIFVSLSAGFSDITSFLKLGSENVSLKIAKLFLPPSGPQRLKSQR